MPSWRWVLFSDGSSYFYDKGRYSNAKPKTVKRSPKKSKSKRSKKK